MKIANKKLLIFDFDGTLIDSVPDLTLAINHMLITIKREEFSQKIIHTWVGNGAKTLVKRALLGKSDIREDIDDNLFEKALDIFLKFYAKNICVKTVIYPNVLTTLQELKKSGFILAIVTNKPFDFVEPILNGLGLDGLFSLCLGGDSLKLKKPNPMPLLHLCKRFKIDVKDSVMIGDSKNDILAAKAANMQSIGVSYGYNYGESILKYEPDVVIDDMLELLEVLI